MKQFRYQDELEDSATRMILQVVEGLLAPGQCQPFLAMVSKVMNRPFFFDKAQRALEALAELILSKQGLPRLTSKMISYGLGRAQERDPIGLGPDSLKGQDEETRSKSRSKGRSRTLFNKLYILDSFSDMKAVSMKDLGQSGERGRREGFETPVQLKF
jgi:hypothetical protein